MKSSLPARLALSLCLSIALAQPLAAQDAQPPAATDARHTPSAALPHGWNPADWDQQDSEFTPEAGWHFGKLDNGLRYIIRRNNRPENTALVRMEIAAGSIDERDGERGFAHFVEHMAFNGSAQVPEGEMVKLLERQGLAFGPDTNASTGFERTLYMLNLPRADDGLLDTALMLMRETASELTISQDAVNRERGVVLSERRVRNTYGLKNTIDGLEFAYPDALVPKRLPIGTAETLGNATAAGLRGFWQREYTPSDTVLVVVGDFDPAMVEEKIRARFASWAQGPQTIQPDAGPIDPSYRGQTDIYLDPALTENVSLMRHGAYTDTPDTLAQRRKALLRYVGSNIVGRRLNRLQRSENPPFRGVNIATSDFFEDGKVTELSVSAEEGGWQRALEAAVDEYRRAMTFGFTEAEIAEQMSNVRSALQNAAANSATRSNQTFAAQALAIANGKEIADNPADQLARFEDAAGSVTPAAVLAEMRDYFLDLDDPLIRFTGKTAPEGGAEALRSAVVAAFAREISPPDETATAEFAYTEFGPASAVVSDTQSSQLDIRQIRYANGVRLNLKRTDLEDDRVNIRVAIDGGEMLASRDNPLAVELGGLLSSGGLGQHSRDELQTILAGRSVAASFGVGTETFDSAAATTRRDLELQLQLLAALVSDPGYRAEGLGSWRQGLDDFFARLDKTPAAAFREAMRTTISDNDPRFTRQPIDAYRALDFTKLKSAIADRLQNGAVEIALVGDFDEAEAIRMVGATFGALPPRESDFAPYEAQRASFTMTQKRGVQIVRHKGESDQSQLQLVWPTTDDSDWDTSSRLSLLARVARLMLTEKMREELGQTYSPTVSSDQSSTYRGFGTFMMGAAVDVAQLDAARAAMAQVVDELRAGPPDADLIQRARQPLLESLDNRLKSNGGWMALVGRAQSEADDIERFVTAKARYEAMTGEDLHQLAQQYLAPGDAVEFRVLPEAPVKPQ
ncbi:M16 family metallopeptidase [Allopontixanthobacter confluentis]|nr:insulinase family protein [Allopontixanthobacter confluentis]